VSGGKGRIGGDCRRGHGSWGWACVTGLPLCGTPGEEGRIERFGIDGWDQTVCGGKGTKGVQDRNDVDVVVEEGDFHIRQVDNKAEVCETRLYKDARILLEPTKHHAMLS
jgi:hypothetical protein